MNHAATLLSLDRVEEADATLREAEAIAARSIDAEDHDHISGRLAYFRAGVFEAEERWGESAAAAARAAALFRASVGNESPAVAFAQLLRGRVLIDAGRRAEAAATLRETRSILVEALGPDHPDVTTVDSVLAVASR